MPRTEPETWQVLGIHLPSKRGIKKKLNASELPRNYKFEAGK